MWHSCTPEHNLHHSNDQGQFGIISRDEIRIPLIQIQTKRKRVKENTPLARDIIPPFCDIFSKARLAGLAWPQPPSPPSVHSLVTLLRIGGSSILHQPLSTTNTNTTTKTDTNTEIHKIKYKYKDKYK